MLSEWIKSGGAAMCDAGISVYNGCTKVLYGILLANPAGASSSATPDDVAEKISTIWNGLFHGSAYNVFATIAGVFTIVFFVVGFCKDSIDITKISNIETIISLFIRLILAVACVSMVGVWIPKAIGAGIGVCNKIFGEPKLAGITMSGEEMLEGIDNSIVSLIFGLIFMIVLIACGAGILYIGIIRICNLIIHAVLAPLMLAPMAGGSGINRSAGIWLRTFIALVFSNVVILLSMYISSGLVGMKLIEGNSIIVAIVTVVEVVVVVGFIKTAESILHKLLGVT